MELSHQTPMEEEWTPKTEDFHILKGNPKPLPWGSRVLLEDKDFNRMAKKGLGHRFISRTEAIKAGWKGELEAALQWSSRIVHTRAIPQWKLWFRGVKGSGYLLVPETKEGAEFAKAFLYALRENHEGFLDHDWEIPGQAIDHERYAVDTAYALEVDSMGGFEVEHVDVGNHTLPSLEQDFKASNEELFVPEARTDCEHIKNSIRAEIFREDPTFCKRKLVRSLIDYYASNMVATGYLKPSPGMLKRFIGFKARTGFFGRSCTDKSTWPLLLERAMQVQESTKFHEVVKREARKRLSIRKEYAYAWECEDDFKVGEYHI
jgi:hypothetical protein